MWATKVPSAQFISEVDANLEIAMYGTDAIDVRRAGRSSAAPDGQRVDRAQSPGPRNGDSGNLHKCERPRPLSQDLLHCRTCARAQG